MLNDTLSDCMADLEESLQSIMKTLLDEAASSIIKSLDADGSEVLEWNEFKQCMHNFSQKKENLMQLIKKAKGAKN